MMNILTTVSLLLSMFALTALAAPTPTTVCSFLANTGRFLTINAEGQISANGDFGSQESQFYVHFLPGKVNHARLQSVKTEKPCFLVFEDGEFKGGQPSMGNDEFEMIQIGKDKVALRVVNPPAADKMEGSGVGSGEEDTSEEVSDYYLGFSSATSKPTVYSTADDAATHFFVIHSIAYT